MSEQEEEQGQKLEEEQALKKDKYKTHKKKYSGQAHIEEEWDSNSDSDFDDEGVATIAIRTSTPIKSLFGEMSDDDTPKCLMVKGRKVKS